MRRIDFLGAPGVGKSSIYNILLHHRGENKIWLTPEELKFKVYAKQYGKKNTLKLKILNLLINQNNILFPFIKAKLQKEFSRLENETIFAKKDIYNTFMEYALSIEGQVDKDAFRRFKGLGWFFDTLKTVAWLEQTETDDWVIFDESLCQKVFGIINSDQCLEQEKVEGYFQSLPLPEALVHLRLNPDENFKRIKSRQKMIPAHKALSDKGILKTLELYAEISGLGASILESRGCVVFHLDMVGELKNNAEVLENHIIRIANNGK